MINTQLNVLHGTKWKLALSNIPSLSKVTDLRLYEQYIKSVSIPDENIEIDWLQDHNIKRFNPVYKPNTNLSDVQLTFKITEDMSNYFNLLEFMLQLRYGKVDTDTLRENVVKTISIILLDNEKRERGSLSFNNCMLHNISSFSMEYGSADEITFTTNWQYEHLTYATKGIL